MHVYENCTCMYSRCLPGGGEVDTKRTVSPFCFIMCAVMVPVLYKNSYSLSHNSLVYCISSVIYNLNSSHKRNSKFILLLYSELHL